jgi:hypothetical protein
VIVKVFAAAGDRSPGIVEKIAAVGILILALVSYGHHDMEKLENYLKKLIVMSIASVEAYKYIRWLLERQ